MAKNFSDTYLYRKYPEYDKKLFQFIMNADRIDTKGEEFEDIMYDVKRRKISDSVAKVIQSPNTIIGIQPGKALPKALKVFVAKDVKEVLAWTASGNADVGFVYLSDALSNDNVKIIETISEEYHSPITYPIAVIKDSPDTDAAKAFEDFLFTEEAQNILKKYGYKSVE